MSNRRRRSVKTFLASEPAPLPVALYDCRDVAAALGDDHPADNDGFIGDPEEFPKYNRVNSDSEQQARLRAILAHGDQGRWRTLVCPSVHVAAAVEALGARAPHLAELSDLVARHVKAARNMGQPLTLPPTLLVGPPGTGKSWYLQRLAAALGLPFRAAPANLSSLSDGLTGSHPVWRSAGPGLVARTLLQESLANPMIFVDEIDKATAYGRDADPFRPFYSLLEPDCARALVDEYLQFAINASHIVWVAAANDVIALPAPIVDRLTILEVPEMTRAHRVAVVRSIYADANAARGHFFTKRLADGALERLLDANPRRARAAVDDAMIRAAAAGRKALRADDVHVSMPTQARRIGFGRQ